MELCHKMLRTCADSNDSDRNIAKTVPEAWESLVSLAETRGLTMLMTMPLLARLELGGYAAMAGR